MSEKTQGERLASIETLLTVIRDEQAKQSAKLDALEVSHQADKADLAALQNKGAGLLIGIALAGGAAGAGIAKAMSAIFSTGG